MTKREKIILKTLFYLIKDNVESLLFAISNSGIVNFCQSE